MFRNLLITNQTQTSTNPEVFREALISMRLPPLEKKWAKLESDIKQILEILTEEGEPLHSEDSKKLTVKFLNSHEDGTLYFETNSKIKLGETKEFILYKKQKNGILEFCFELINITGNIISCKPKSIYTSEEKRHYSRFPNIENLIYVEEFEVAEFRKHLKDYLNENIEEIFTTLKLEYQITHPNLEIFYLYNSKNLTPEEKALALEKKVAFVEVTKELKSYPGDFFNLEEFYKTHSLFSIRLNTFQKENLSSFIMYPIYFKFKNKKIFIGMSYLWEKHPNKIPTSDIFVLEEIENKISAKILENKNTVVQSPQEIINFSKGGVLFKIADSDIAQAIIARPKFSAKICKKEDQSIWLKFHAKNIYQIEKDYYIGAEILGNPNSDPDILIYFEWIKEREA